GPAPRRVRVTGEQGLLDLAAEAARMAGAPLLERAAAGSGSGVAGQSTPTAPLSGAEPEAQHPIPQLVSTARPRARVRRGEWGDADGESGLRWVVDALDGTVNYLFGIPQWSVSVAVADAEGTLAGAVYDPNRDELFTAGREAPALMAGPSGRAELHGRAAD